MQFAVGALAMRGAGCTINDMWDRYTLTTDTTTSYYSYNNDTLIEILINTLRGLKHDHWHLVN